MKRTLKQEWSYERLFFHKGSLAGIVVRLRQIAGAPSTLRGEAGLLRRAAELVECIDVNVDKELSFAQFSNMRGSRWHTTTGTN